MGDSEETKEASKIAGSTASWQGDKETASHPASVPTAADAAVQTVQQEPENPEPRQLLDAPSLVAAPSTIADETTLATTALNLAADSFVDEGIYSECDDSEQEDLFI